MSATTESPTARATRPRSNPLDPVFKALADATRRDLLDILRARPRTTSELVERFPELSRFAVMKHLQVLRDANLVISRHEGRRTTNSLNAVPIRQIYDRWVSHFAGRWAQTLVSLKTTVESKARSAAARRGPRPKP
jgi:DNA-binding transcriptional ArsR family regulator